jgi:hypothetical protein
MGDVGQMRDNCEQLSYANLRHKLAVDCASRNLGIRRHVSHGGRKPKLTFTPFQAKFLWCEAVFAGS